MSKIDEAHNKVRLWRGFNSETGEGFSEYSKSAVLAKIMNAENFKTISRTETYMRMAEILAQWEITAVE